MCVATRNQRCQEKLILQCCMTLPAICSITDLIISTPPLSLSLHMYTCCNNLSLMHTCISCSLFGSLAQIVYVRIHIKHSYRHSRSSLSHPLTAASVPSIEHRDLTLQERHSAVSLSVELYHDCIIILSGLSQCLSLM